MKLEQFHLCVRKHTRVILKKFNLTKIPNQGDFNNLIN